tara:strand:- start:386 stop:646 length:261 start_codon:yes stop_codon:yes gene_type:complete
MGKKSRTSETSKGERRNVSKFNCTAVVADSLVRQIRQREAWKKGKRVVLTIENPNKTETNRRFIKVSGKDLWGEYRHQKAFTMTGS